MDDTEEHHFVLNVMKLVFNISNQHFPYELQKRLDRFPKFQDGNVTANVGKAGIICIDEYGKKPLADIGSDRFKGELDIFRRKFDVKRLLEFCFLYGRKAVKELKDGQENSPFQLYESIMDVLNCVKKDGTFTSKSWEELDRYALYVIMEDNKKLMEYRKKAGKVWDWEIRREQQFVLRLMDYIFQLHFRELPRDLQKIIDDNEDYEDIHFTDTVRNAVVIIMNNQISVGERIGEMNMEDYYLRLSMHFEETEFLEACVCYARRAVEDYFEQNNHITPMRIYKFLVNALENARECMMFTSFDKLWNICRKIISQDEESSEHEKVTDHVSAAQAFGGFTSSFDSGSGSHMFHELVLKSQPLSDLKSIKEEEAFADLPENDSGSQRLGVDEDTDPKCWNCKFW